MEYVGVFNTIVFYLFIVYTITIIFSYLLLIVISLFESVSYFKKNSFVDYEEIMNSQIVPSISIIAPAYNESANIIENVRSLLSNFYANYDVIIVNDGSTDDSLAKLIEAYDLVKVPFLINEQIPTQPLREGVFKSTNPAYDKLIVIDKQNGGKSDALNLGLNISSSQYVACIDVDCLLLEDALQKMIKPFLESTDVKVIATGGFIRIANSCIIEDGKLIEINYPKSILERTQILEYLRSFLLGRMAWSKLNGLLVISGAFGLFDKQVAIEAGGYDVGTVGEDMEIIVRMRRRMEEQKIKYKVGYIPNPLCWTEAPDHAKVLISQRNRWTRGTIETLKKHRKIALNPKYGVLGMISYPYWFIYERLAPIIEVFGMLYLFFLAYTHSIRWDYALALVVLAYLFTILFSLAAIYVEQFTFNQYKRKGNGVSLLLTVLLEPFTLHPIILYAAIKGNIQYYFRKDVKWGKMTRKGFKNNKKTSATKTV